jgi:Flp pilus assembly protein TadG
LNSFLGDQTGASFLMAALSFPVLLGMAGLGLDAIAWYQDKRHNQTIADNAAVAGTIAATRNPSITQAELEAIILESTSTNGFIDGTHGTVDVNHPPSVGPNAGAPALDPTEDGAITVTGTADVTSDCGMASNSNSDQSIYVAGSADLSAQPLQAYGDIDESGNATITYESPPQPLSERLDDPYEGVLNALQADPGCVGVSPQTYSGSDSPLSPGRYCGGIRINGNVDFLPGTYYVDNGDFKISGGGDIRGPGVTFILTAMDAKDLGSVDLSGGGLVDLRAPADETEGEYPGMLLIQDPYVPNVQTHSPLPKNMLTGGSNMHLNGALYFRDLETVYTGGTAGGANCTLIAGRTVTFEGEVHLNNDAQACLEAGVTGIQQTRVRLVE